MSLSASVAAQSSQPEPNPLRNAYFGDLVLTKRNFPEPDVVIGDGMSRGCTQLALDTAGKSHGFASSIAISAAWIVAIAKAVGVERIAGVHM